MVSTKITIGSLLILIVSSLIIYVSMEDKVRFRVDRDKSTLYIKLLDEDGNPYGNWLIAGREYNKLYNGSTLQYRSLAGINIDISNITRNITITFCNETIIIVLPNGTNETSCIDWDTNVTEYTHGTLITRTTPYKNGAVIVDTYRFDGFLSTIANFPIYHKIEIFNGTGLYYRYEVKNLIYDGPTFKLDGNQTSMKFGRGVKVTWWEGYRLGWIYKSGSMYVKSEKLISDYEVFNVRLFDPIDPTIIYPEGLMYYYKLNNDTDGTNAADAINYPLNNATGVSITGSEWESSFNSTFDKAIHLDGSVDYFDTGVQTLASWTIMVMVYSDVGSRNEEIIGQMDPGAGNGMFIRRFTDGYIRCYTGDGNYLFAPTNDPQPLQTWVFYACTYNATSQEIIMYVNGTAQNTVGSNGYIIGNNDIFIGGIQSGQSEVRFNGIVDEVAIWNITLDANNISEMWGRELGKAPPILIPAISNVNNGTVTITTAVITWDTDISSNSSAILGTSITNLSIEAINVTLVTTGHNVIATGLDSGTFYYYNVTSCTSDDACNSTGIFNFTTEVNPYEISSCSNLTEAGATYNMTADISDYSDSPCMFINATNVIFDCKGYKIDGDGSANYGIQVKGVSNITVKNCIVTDFDYGFFATTSGNISITDTILANSTTYDFWLDTSGLDSRCHNNITNLTGTGNKPIVYYNGTVNIQDWDNNVSEIYLCNADNSNITNVTIISTRGNNGIIISDSDNVNVSHTIIENTYRGINARNSQSHDYYNVSITNSSTTGIYIFRVHNSTIRNSTISENTDGIIALDVGENNFVNIDLRNNTYAGLYFIVANIYNYVVDSRFTNNKYGIYLDADDVILYNNIIENSSSAGIFLAALTDNVTFYNNLINETNQFTFEASNLNYWNTTLQLGTRIFSDGIKIAGNFWTNPTATGWSDNCTDSVNDGFCDLQYNLTDDGFNIDYKPLSSKYLSPNVNLTLGGFNQNITAEIGPINVSANVTSGVIVCVDVDHPSFGINYSCDTSSTSFILDIPYFRKIELNDSTTIKNLSYNGPQNQTVYIRSHQYDEIYNLSINLNGYLNNGTYPTNIKIYVNGTLSNEVGDVFSGNISIDTLNDGNTTKDIVFIGAGIQSVFIDIPKVANVTYGIIDISGETDVVVDVGDGSDGDFVFTSTNQTFGSLVAGVDYTNISNTVFLNASREYNFIYFNLGTGMILSVNGTNMSTLFLRVNETTEIHGIINLSNRTESGPSSASFFATDEGTINSPNAYEHGSGGFSTTTFCTTPGIQPTVGYGVSGGSPFGTNGNGTGIISQTDGSYTTNGTNATGKSAGGGGGISAYLVSTEGQCYITLNGGNGGNSYGSAGTDASTFLSHDPGEWECNWCMVANGGGGAGGEAGKPGIHFYLKGLTVNLTGIIDTSGTSGQNGGRGGKTKAYTGTDADFGYGGQGGDGGGGSNAGDVVIYYQTFNITGDILSNSGTGGTGGERYNAFETQWETSGTNGITGSDGSYIPNDYTNLLNPFIRIGNISGIPVWNHTGFFSTSNSTRDVSNESNEYLLTCSENDNGDCSMPIYFNSDSAGIMRITAIDFVYNFDPNPILLDLELLRGFVNNSINETDIPITIENDLNGTLEIGNISFDYLGGNKSYNVTAHTIDYSSNLTFKIDYYYSAWNYVLPNNIYWLEFIPQTPTSVNVTPFGQTNSRPILNFTSYSYNNINSNFSLYLNEQHFCVDLTIGVTSNKSEGFTNISKWMELFELNYLNTSGIWMWADYDCSFSQWTLWQPNISFRACCDTCIVCSEEV